MISQVERDLSIQNRLPGSGRSTPSPPSSPRLCRSRSKSSGQQPSRTLAHRLSWILLSVLLRRQGILLFAPLIYISCMLFHMRVASFDAAPIIHRRPAPGSVYRSPQVYARLRADIDADNTTADAVRFASVLSSFCEILLRMWPLCCLDFRCPLDKFHLSMSKKVEPILVFGACGLNYSNSLLLHLTKSDILWYGQSRSLHYNRVI